MILVGDNVDFLVYIFLMLMAIIIMSVMPFVLLALYIPIKVVSGKSIFDIIEKDLFEENEICLEKD